MCSPKITEERSGTGSFDSGSSRIPRQARPEGPVTLNAEGGPHLGGPIERPRQDPRSIVGAGGRRGWMRVKCGSADFWVPACTGRTQPRECRGRDGRQTRHSRSATDGPGGRDLTSRSSMEGCSPKTLDLAGPRSSSTLAGRGR